MHIAGPGSTLFFKGFSFSFFVIFLISDGTVKLTFLVVFHALQVNFTLFNFAKRSIAQVMKRLRYLNQPTTVFVTIYCATSCQITPD